MFYHAVIKNHVMPKLSSGAFNCIRIHVEEVHSTNLSYYFMWINRHWPTKHNPRVAPILWNISLALVDCIIIVLYQMLRMKKKLIDGWQEIIYLTIVLVVV